STAASVTTPKTPTPSVPTGVTASANSATSVTVKWTASTDTGGPGLGGYSIFRGGTKIGSVNATTTSYTDATLSANTTYSYTVQAYDTASPPNVSAQSTAASVTTPKTPTPSVPTGVTASANSATSVTVKWTASTDTGGPGLAGYYIIRNGTTIAQVTASTSSPITYTDTTVSPNTTYSYTIEAFDLASPPNVSAPSSAASVTTPAATNATPPTTPTDLQATAVSSSQINLNWTASTANVTVEGYYVYRSTHNHRHSTYSLVATVATNSYGNTNLSAKTTYYYYVVAFDSAGRSGKSSVVNAVTKANALTTTTVQGTVTSTTTQSPLSGVLVRTGIRGTSDGAATSYTDSDGEYVLDNVKANHFETYHYSHSGYNTLRLYKNLPSGIHTLNASLTPKQHRHHRR
ncbi:MAG TPA: fibronectin type III domain-containing protein, partial [Candidatus Dormibacteraeota bacterium]|nr:fibronectin type III domain-containing protein [Candidatus Dormibacteraeota bacterium]